MAHTPRTIHEKQYKALVEQVRLAREAAGLRQEDVAKLVGLTQSMYSKIERTERRLDILEFVRIAKAIKVDPAELLSDGLAGRTPRMLTRGE